MVDIYIVLINLPKPTECATLGVNHNVNYQLWVTTGHSKLVDCTKCTISMGIANGGHCECGGIGNIWNSVLSAQLLSKSKTVLKYKVYLTAVRRGNATPRFKNPDKFYDKPLTIKMENQI